MPLFQQRRNPVSGRGGFLSMRLSPCISRCFHYPFLASLERHRLHPFHDLEIKGSHTICLPGCSGLHDNTIVRRYTFLTRQDRICMNFSGVFTKGRRWMYQTWFTCHPWSGETGASLSARECRLIWPKGVAD